MILAVQLYNRNKDAMELNNWAPIWLLASEISRFRGSGFRSKKNFRNSRLFSLKPSRKDLYDFGDQDINFSGGEPGSNFSRRSDVQIRRDTCAKELRISQPHTPNPCRVRRVPRQGMGPERALEDFRLDPAKWGVNGKPSQVKYSLSLKSSLELLSSPPPVAVSFVRGIRVRKLPQLVSGPDAGSKPHGTNFEFYLVKPPSRDASQTAPPNPRAMRTRHHQTPTHQASHQRSSKPSPLCPW
ncbi:hypothetical protein VNO77_30532 [Canavalia gladiata]|uniref:Uncharacterized protein n=1 Tax=Canavalia gladiata TaxID=3824 RepID=A0AAN9KPJ5_CANGL